MDEDVSYRVIARREETPTVVVVHIAPSAGARPEFIPGQFVNVALPSTASEAKSYTPVSTPSEEGYEIAVRRAGPFSQALAALHVGDELIVSEPYGFFYPEEYERPWVFFAGGIGITPFVSILRSAQAHPPVSVLYSNRSAGDIAFERFIDELSESKRITAQHHITREGEKPGARKGRIDETAVRALSPAISEVQYFLCGSIGFVRDMRLLLKSLGAPEIHIVTEAFY